MARRWMGWSFSLAALLLAGVAWTPATPWVAAADNATPAPAARPLAATPMGINLEDVRDWSHSLMFVDAINSSRKPGTPEKPWDENAALDQAGWPAGDFGICVMTGIPHIEGTYNLVCNGPATITPVASQGVTVVNNHYEQSTNTTTAQVVVPPNATQLFLAFTNTRGGVHDLRLYRPGYDPAHPPTFTKEFLAAIAPFQTLRAMDYLQTNNSRVIHWNERSTPLSARQSGPNGAAYEYLIELANTAKKDLWINIPYHADDDYVRELATLLKTTLLPDRAVYVELSNELWNSGFAQARDNLDATKTELGTSSTNLTVDGDNNVYSCAAKHAARRVVEISRIFRQVYGDSAMNTRVRPVLGYQAAVTYHLRRSLDYLTKVYGPPRNDLYGIASAPYLWLPDDVRNKENHTSEQILDALDSHGIPYVSKLITAQVAIAKAQGLQPLTYEGGQHVEGKASMDAKIAANRDPRMGQILEKYLREWYSSGGGMFCYYSLCSAYSQHGCWGLTDDITQGTSKTSALANIQNHPPQLTAGVDIPATLNAVNDASASYGGKPEHRDDGLYFCGLTPGNQLEYLVYVPQAGTYEVVVTLSMNAGPEPTLAMEAAGQTGLTVKWPANAPHDKKADAPGVRVHLDKGLQAVGLRVLTGTANVGYLRFTKVADSVSDVGH